MTPDVDVRRFEPGDGERVRELNERAMATTPEYVPEAPDEDLDDVVGQYLEAEGCEFLVGAADGSVVGTGAYVPLGGWKTEHVDDGSADLEDTDDGSADFEDTDDANADLEDTDDANAAAELTRMRVDPEFHGRGVGTAIYEALERRARADGYREFVLDTGVENDRARGFYESLGFYCLEEVTVEWGEIALELAICRRAIE